VTQEVIIDRTAPSITFTAPAAGQLVPDATNLTITWTLTDVPAVSTPTAVMIEYSPTGADPWTTIAAAAPFTPGSTGSYLWAVPNISGADVTTYRIRITAVDKAGAPVGNIPGHTTVRMSETFTVYDAPVAATGVVGDDPDTTADSGVDGRDFRANWTLPAPGHIVLQQVFVLPVAQTLNLTTAPVDVPVASFPNNTTATWTGTASLDKDSRGASLGEGEYKFWIVVSDAAGRTATASSAPFAVAAP